MSFNNLEYQRKYIANYKNTMFGKYSVKISEIKRKARFYHNQSELAMTLTTDNFIDTILPKFNYICACCNNTEELLPCLVKRLCNNGLVSIENTIPLCKSCVRSYHSRRKLTFEQWYQSQPFYSQERYNKILNHIKESK